MQSNKASKKTRKIAEEPLAAKPETGVAGTASARSSKARTSNVDKAENSDLVSGTHRHKTDAATQVEPVSTEGIRTKSMTAAASARSANPQLATGWSESLAEKKTARPATHEEIAKLAFSYWIARGAAHGSADQDWLRAERELVGQRS